MKKTLLFFSLVMGVAFAASAQVCTPDSTHFGSGQFVYPDTLPCIARGQAYNGVISIMVPDSVDIHNFYPQAPANTFYAYIDSMRIDSITGTPSGITAASNPGAGVWLKGGQFGCALFSGTTTATVGSYPLVIWGAGCLHGTFPIIGALDTCQYGDLSSYLNFTLDVCAGVGVSEIAGNMDINVYPNPNHGNFTVTVSSADHVSGQLSVMDQLGRTIRTQEIDVTGTKQIPLELGNVSAGVYILVMNTSKGKTVRSFSVK